MSISIFLVCVSLGTLFSISVYRFIKLKNIPSFMSQLLFICMFFIFIYHFFIAPDMPIKRGKENNEVYFVIILYCCMLIGMFAQSAYTRFQRPKRHRTKFDFGLFISPIFASPVIFLPLLASMQNADIDFDTMTSAKTMVFFVAFENGFFWKEFFDNRQKLKTNNSETSKKVDRNEI